VNDERTLVARAQRGDTVALEELARAHRPVVLRVARHVLGDATLAEDVAQDALMRLQLSLPGFRGEAELGTWLYRITLNLCRNQMRKRRVDQLDDQALHVAESGRVTTADSTDRSIDRDRARQAVRAAIDRLPDDQKEVVVLRFMSDLSYADIARITASPPGTISSRLFRALKRLGRELEPHHLELIT